MFYSLTNGFTEQRVSEDQTEITDESWEKIILGQAEGKVITVDNNGSPVLTEPPALTQEDEINLANTKKTTLISDANSAISLWQTELLLGVISDADKASLTQWVTYIKALQGVDTSTAPDITWPTSPDDESTTSTSTDTSEETAATS